MDYNQIRDEGLAIHKAYVQDAADWRRARILDNEAPKHVTPIKRLKLAWTAVMSVLFGR